MGNIEDISRQAVHDALWDTVRDGIDNVTELWVTPTDCNQISHARLQVDDTVGVSLCRMVYAEAIYQTMCHH